MDKLSFTSIVNLLFLCHYFASTDAFSPDVLPVKGRLLTPAEGCGHSIVPQTRIVGGTFARNGAWPWVAMLGYKVRNFTVFNAGGSLITSRHVLSAAHCISQNLIAVRLGEYDIRTTDDGPHETIRIRGARIHDDFDLVLGTNDIAIIYLARDVEFNDRIRPICLPINGETKDRNLIGSMPFVAGWGKMGDQKEAKRSAILMQIQLPIIENNDCKAKYKLIGEYKNDDQFHDGVLCAGFTAGGQDACQGDSGGPMMLPIQENGHFPFYQIGVISYGIGCAQPNVPGVYANVSYYADWIKEKLRF